MAKKTLQIIDEEVHIADGQSILDFEDYFTSSFFSKLNNKSEVYRNDSFYVNELYITFIQPFLLVGELMENNDVGIQSLDFNRASERIRCYCLDYRANQQAKVSPLEGFMYRLKFLMLAQVYVLLSAGYLMLSMLKIKRASMDEEFEDLYIARTKASKAKLKGLGVTYLSEDYTASDASAYAQFGILRRIGWVLSAWLKAYRQLSQIKKLMVHYSGNNTAMLSVEYFSKRVVHTLVYQTLIRGLLKRYEPKRFFTGNNLDRFSVVEEEACKRHGVQVVCIPHGLEYGFKFPKGFSGDVFYTTSANAATYLNELYCESKFIFSEELAQSIFKVNYQGEESDQPKVVYFSEPRDKSVNHKIIAPLVDLLRESGIQLAIKLHPKDAVDEYNKYNVEILGSLEASLQENICIARKSTTLLEATYNGSVAAAVLISSKDKSIFETFPSLQDVRIKQFYNIQDLYLWVLEQLNRDQTINL